MCAYRIIGRLRPGCGRTAASGSGQIVSGGLLALSHGTNDAQKTMGIITLALIANGNIASDDFHVPTWVVVSSATAIALGTYAGGWRIIRTLGTRIIKMDPAQGFAAQGAGATVILASSHFGYPLSTTHTISGAVMGAGAAKRLSAVRWGVAGNIVMAWILTLPAAGAIGAVVYGVTRDLRHRRAGPVRRVRARGRPDRGDLRAALRHVASASAPLPVDRGRAMTVIATSSSTGRRCWTWSSLRWWPASGSRSRSRSRSWA